MRFKFIKFGHWQYLYIISICLLLYDSQWFIIVINLIKEGKRTSFSNYKKINLNFKPYHFTKQDRNKNNIGTKNHILSQLSPPFSFFLFFSFPSFHFFIFFLVGSESVPPPFGGKRGGRTPVPPSIATGMYYHGLSASFNTETEQNTQIILEKPSNF